VGSSLCRLNQLIPVNGTETIPWVPPPEFDPKSQSINPGQRDWNI